MNQSDFWQRWRRPPPAPERRTHIALADRLRLQADPDWWWSHMPAGEHRSAATGALLKAMGLRPGMLDFLLIDPNGRHYWLELKRGQAPLTNGQIDFTDMLRARGVPYYIARNYDAAVAQLKTWGAI
jgi:hypothetical protein